MTIIATNPASIECTEPACMAESHIIDLDNPEDSAFHEAQPVRLDKFAVRVTRYDDDAWDLDVEAESTLTTDEAMSLADAIIRQASVARDLNARAVSNHGR